MAVMSQILEMRFSHRLTQAKHRVMSRLFLFPLRKLRHLRTVLSAEGGIGPQISQRDEEALLSSCVLEAFVVQSP